MNNLDDPIIFTMKGTRKERKSKPNPRDKYGMKKYRKDHTACETCGATGELGTHHKDGDKANNSLSNFAVKCNDCHRKEHPELPDWMFK